MVKKIICISLLVACVSCAHAQTDMPRKSLPQKRSAAVIPFAVASSAPTSLATLSEGACPPTNRTGSSVNNVAPADAAKPDTNLKVDSRTLDAITDELLKRLSKKMSAISTDDPRSIPLGALVITGCITKADPGNPTGRLVGMNLGTSHLDAHVKILSKAETGFLPVAEFDIQAKGGKILPPLGPIGLAAHAAAERRETLTADGKKLADALLKKLAATAKSQTRLTETD